MHEKLLPMVLVEWMNSEFGDDAPTGYVCGFLEDRGADGVTINQGQYPDRGQCETPRNIPREWIKSITVLTAKDSE
jgi:hypothetical protein